jgi:hypothetical protein
MMAENEMLLVKADSLSLAIHRGEIVVVFDLSSAQVFPKELGVRLLPAEARGVARQLEEWAEKAETASSPRS